MPTTQQAFQELQEMKPDLDANKSLFVFSLKMRNANKTLINKRRVEGRWRGLRGRQVFSQRVSAPTAALKTRESKGGDTSCKMLVNYSVMS